MPDYRGCRKTIPTFSDRMIFMEAFVTVPLFSRSSWAYISPKWDPLGHQLDPRTAHLCRFVRCVDVGIGHGIGDGVASWLRRRCRCHSSYDSFSLGGWPLPLFLSSSLRDGRGGQLQHFSKDGDRDRCPPLVFS